MLLESKQYDAALDVIHRYRIKDETVTQTTLKKDYKLSDDEISNLHYLNVKNPYYSSASPMKLFLHKEVKEYLLVRTPPVKKPRKKRTVVKKIKTINYSELFTKRYEGKPVEDIIFDCCTGMFHLNRYAKHLHPNSDYRETIYLLKNKLVEFLYKTGYSVDVYEHYLYVPEKECWNCWGCGYHNGETCRSCDGTGIYMEEETLTFIVFRFKIKDQLFTWHQPEEIINFSYSTTCNSERMTEIEQKEVEATEDELQEFKKLIEWFLTNKSEFNQNKIEEKSVKTMSNLITTNYETA